MVCSPWRPSLTTVRVLLVVLGVSCVRGEGVGAARAAQLDSAVSDSAFAAISAALSEQGGYFDTDNLISNESAYLQVVAALRERDIGGGAYLGVGPGQNFSYIAQIQPAIAFIVDIRRDNLLHHLLYKALFEASEDRLLFLGNLLGRDVSAVRREPASLTIDELLEVVDNAPRSDSSITAAIVLVRDWVQRSGFPLSEADLTTIERFHRTFIRDGLDLRFNSFGRAPQPYYPTLRRLFLEVDEDGVRRNYLASSDLYQVVRDLELRNLIIPVVGDLSGRHAVRAIGQWLSDSKMPVTAFYTSNVEFYLWQNGSFGEFVANLASLPRDRDAVLIRSYFGGGFRRGPRIGNGYANAQLLQSIDELISDWEARRYRTYLDVVWR